MPDSNPLMQAFLDTASAIAPAHPEVDAATIREIFVEAATVLHNGLALDGLDEHDTDLVIRGLCTALADGDPGAAIRARSRGCAADADLHDAKAVSASYLIAAGLLQV